MNLQQIAERASAIATDLETLTALPEWTDEQRSQFDALNTELGGLETRKADIEARSAVLARAQSMTATGDAPARYSAPNITVKKDPFDLNELRGFLPTAELRGRAKSAVEVARYLDDDGKQEATRKLEHVDDLRGIIPNLIIRTGNEHYTSAFHKGMAGMQALWTSEEREAIQLAQEYRTAMSLSDSAGGYGVPFQLDPTLILTNNGAINPTRAVARQVTITGDSWNGLSSAGVTASFDAELAEVSDDSPTFAQPTVQTREARGFVMGSIAITQDFANLAGELTMAFADAKDRLESSVFWSGASGSNQPIGIETALAGGSSIVAQSAGEAFTVADIYKVHQALPARWSKGNKVAWTAEKSTINAMRQFATANNYHAFLTDLGGGQPAQLLGYPLYEWSDMDANSAVDAAATATNHLLLLGDWNQYLIADRVGMSIEFVPHVFNTNANLPMAVRGWFAYWRVGADSLVDGAFRLLAVTTAA